MNYERPRNEFPLLLNYWGLLGEGVEIGTCQGLFAQNILEFWPGVLHCVDPWAKVDGYEETYDHEANYQETLGRLGKYGPRVQIHRATSEEFHLQCRDESFDFCYLDGRHDYEGVRADLDRWWPKVKCGGLFGGDDFGIIGEQWVNFGHGRVRFGVRRAVEEWAFKHRRNISIDILADWRNMIPGQGELQARGWWCLK